jgi:hypothetical protein
MDPISEFLAAIADDLLGGWAQWAAAAHRNDSAALWEGPIVAGMHSGR